MGEKGWKATVENGDNLPRDIAFDTRSHPVLLSVEAAGMRRGSGRLRLTWLRRGQTTSLLTSVTEKEVVREDLGGIAMQTPLPDTEAAGSSSRTHAHPPKSWVKLLQPCVALELSFVHPAPLQLASSECELKLSSLAVRVACTAGAVGGRNAINGELES